MNDGVGAMGAGTRVVTITLGRETYGIPIEIIEGIVPWEQPTKVPRMPSFMVGVVSIRGRVLPVLDLGVRMGLEPCDPDLQRRIVILQIRDTWVGCVVDAVREVAWVPTSTVSRSVPLVTSDQADFIEGIAELDCGLVIMLNPDRLLSEKEHKRLEKVSEAVAA